MLFQKQSQDLQGLVLQLDADAVFAEFAGTQVKLKNRETHDTAVFCLVYRHRGSTKQMDERTL